MTGPLLRRNVAHHARLLLAVAAGVAAIEGLLVGAAAQIEAGPGLAGLLAQLVPAPAREVLLSQFGLLSFTGAVAFGFQHPAVLFGAIAFVVVAGTVPSAERESGFADIVLARGIAREEYLAAVALLVLLGAGVLPLAVLGGAAAGLAAVEVSGAWPWTRYAPAAAGLASLLAAIGGYTTAISAGTSRRGLAVARAAGATLAFFVLEAVATFWSALEPFRWISPFHYYKPVSAAIGSQVPWREVAVLLGVAVGGFAVAFARFRRQDL